MGGLSAPDRSAARGPGWRERLHHQPPPGGDGRAAAAALCVQRLADLAPAGTAPSPAGARHHAPGGRSDALLAVVRAAPARPRRRLPHGGFPLTPLGLGSPAP